MAITPSCASRFRLDPFTLHCCPTKKQPKHCTPEISNIHPPYNSYSVCFFQLFPNAKSTLGEGGGSIMAAIVASKPQTAFFPLRTLRKTLAGCSWMPPPSSWRTDGLNSSEGPKQSIRQKCMTTNFVIVSVMVTTGLTGRHQMSVLVSKAMKLMRIHRDTVLHLYFLINCQSLSFKLLS